MSSTAALLSPISKEAHALALPWLAGLAALVLPAVVGLPHFPGGVSVPAYFVATAALGALSLGHEYTGRTMSMLLSQPAPRTRLLAIKLGVLASMLLALWMVAYTLVFGDARMPQTMKQAASVLPVLCSLFLAPWLTMLCRTAIGGTVFTLAIPGTLLVIGELLGVKVYGDGPVMEAFKLSFVWYATLAICAVGGLMTWRKFMRLEAIDGPGAEIRLPHWLRNSVIGSPALANSANRNPIWLLVKKELHLQVLPLALAALFVVGWVGASWVTSGADAPMPSAALAALPLLYAGLVPMIIGASASAGERQMGMLEWQVLQPMAISQQWGIKLGVTYGLSFLLALALPVILLSLSNVGLIKHPSIFMTTGHTLVIAVLLLTGGSLYISSLCGSVLWALVISIPAAMVAGTFFQIAWGRVALPTYRLAMGWAMQLLQPGTIGPINDMRIMEGFTFLLMLGFTALTQRLAFTNHRSAERAWRRMFRQLAILAVFAVAAIVLDSAARGIIVANTMLQLPPQFRSR